MSRQIFEMSKEQYEALMAQFRASKDVPLTEREAFVDKAWDALGDELGFQGSTARCHVGNPRLFTAVPKAKEKENG